MRTYQFLFVSIVPIVLIGISAVPSNNLIQHYVDLINNEINKTHWYDFAQDATEYRPFGSTKTEYYGQFDFIIIGAGSTGSVLIGRLGAVPKWRILVLEAGTYANQFTEIPHMQSYTLYSHYNWALNSIPQRTACLGTVEQRCTVPRGRAIGGTSVINSQLYARGNREDYMNWSLELNNDTTYLPENILRLFKKSENFNYNFPGAPIDWSYHSASGTMRIEYQIPNNPQLQAFLDGFQQFGYPLTDYNAQNQIGVSPTQVNAWKGRKYTTAQGYLTNLGKNVRLLENSYATQILFQYQNQIPNAYGVRFTFQGRYYYAIANREVLVCAGALGSSHLLMVSGIGPRNQLEQLKIPMVQDLPVGERLQDHVHFYGLRFSCNASVTAAGFGLQDFVRDYLYCGRGPLSQTLQGVAFIREPQTDQFQMYATPNIKYTITPTNPVPTLFFESRNFTLTQELVPERSAGQEFEISVFLVHPKSSGTVKLNSSDPFQFPLIDFNMLSDPNGDDIEALYKATDFILDLVKNSKAFQRINATLVTGHLSGCQKYPFGSRNFWECTIRYASGTEYHPMATCRMGVNLENSVVDGKMRVHGITGLRVADYGVVPVTIAGNPNAICIMLGEKLAEDLLNENP